MLGRLGTHIGAENHKNNCGFLICLVISSFLPISSILGHGATLGPSWSGWGRSWGHLGPPWAHFGAPRRHHPKTGQDGPRPPTTAPRRPQDGPKTVQDGPKIAPRQLQDGPKHSLSLSLSLFLSLSLSGSSCPRTIGRPVQRPVGVFNDYIDLARPSAHPRGWAAGLRPLRGNTGRTPFLAIEM